jgi:hypothetical protein
MLGNYGLKAMMNYGFINVYSGDQPLSPDMPATGTLLGQITTDGDPFVIASTTGGALRLAQGDTGVLEKSGAWLLNGSATGTAGWWRWMWNAYDSGNQSFYYPRVDGLVGESLVLASAAITPSTLVAIESFNVQFRG